MNGTTGYAGKTMRELLDMIERQDYDASEPSGWQRNWSSGSRRRHRAGLSTGTRKRRSGRSTMIDNPELDGHPVDLLLFDLRKLIEGGHDTAALMYVDAVERRFKSMVELPF